MLVARLLPVFVVAALSACAPKMYITGHLDDFSEVYTGDGVGGGSSYFNFSGVYTGVNCSTTAHRTIVPLSVSEDDLRCSDGRTAVMRNRPYQGLMFWNGVGTFSDGKVIKVYMSTTRREIDDYLERFKATAKARKQARKQVAVSSPRPETKKAAPAKAPPEKRFPSPEAFRFSKGPERPDDVAVIIGNANYGKQGKDIPDVVPAYADAEAFRQYAKTTLGVASDNIIFLKDATQTNMISTFGSKDNHKGQLYNWVEPGESNVWVYYAGHGAPSGADGRSYLVPADANASTIVLNGYPLETLYANLGKFPARTVTVILEACFSGVSEGGSVISNASPVFMKAKAPPIPANVTVVAAGQTNQIASWEKDKSHGLFTKYFLKGMGGEADAAPYGNGDGTVGWNELDRYFKKTVTKFARRYYGREQTAQIAVGRGE